MDRTHILRRGFADRSPAVVKVRISTEFLTELRFESIRIGKQVIDLTFIRQVVADELLPAWLSQCGGNILALLDNLDVYENQELTMRIIGVLLEKSLKEGEKLERIVNDFVASHVSVVTQDSTNNDGMYELIRAAKLRQLAFESSSERSLRYDPMADCFRFQNLELESTRDPRDNGRNLPS